MRRPQKSRIESLATCTMCLYWPPSGRDVAQPGSASHWGCGGRRFESSRPDQNFRKERPSGGRTPENLPSASAGGDRPAASLGSAGPFHRYENAPPTELNYSILRSIDASPRRQAFSSARAIRHLMPGLNSLALKLGKWPPRSATRWSMPRQRQSPVFGADLAPRLPRTMPNRPFPRLSQD